MSSHDLGAGAGHGTASAKASSGSASDLPPPSERGELVERLTELGNYLAAGTLIGGSPYAAKRAADLLSLREHLLSAEAQITALKAELQTANAEASYAEDRWAEYEKAFKAERARAQAAEAETARLSALLDQAREVIPGLLTLARAYTKGINVDGDNVADIRNGSAFLTRLSKTGGEGEEGVSLSQGAEHSLPSVGRTPAPCDLEGWAALAAEFAKPQFMTTTSGGGKHSLEFTFSGEDGRERRDALHKAMIAAAKAVNS